MKSLREIVYKSLVDNLGVEPGLLSRVEGNAPIVIELFWGEVYVFFQDNSLNTYIEIPIYDRRVISLKAAEFMNIMSNDEQLFMRIKKDKIVIFYELGDDNVGLERRLSDIFKTFNELANQLNM